VYARVSRACGGLLGEANDYAPQADAGPGTTYRPFASRRTSPCSYPGQWSPVAGAHPCQGQAAPCYGHTDRTQPPAEGQAGAISRRETAHEHVSARIWHLMKACSSLAKAGRISRTQHGPLPASPYTPRRSRTSTAGPRAAAEAACWQPTTSGQREPSGPGGSRTGGAKNDRDQGFSGESVP